MQHSHNTICTTLYITLHKQHIHTLYIHNIACAEHHRCNMYNIYNICTIIVTHIQTILSLPSNLASSVCLPSMLILSCHKAHYFHSIDVSFGVTCHNINIGIIQEYNINSYPHDTDLIYLSWLLFLLDSHKKRNLVMPFPCISNDSSIRMILDNPVG